MKITCRYLSSLSVGLTAVLPLSLTTAVLCMAPALVRAQDTTSAIAGVALPKNASRVSDGSITSGMGRLVADGAKDFKFPARSGGAGNAEVYVWKDSAYKPNRAPFLATMLKSALTEAGYTYTDVDSHVDDVPNLYDTDAFHTDWLELGFTDRRPMFFHATNAEKGKTIIGVWIDQESHNRLTLVIGEVGFAGVKSATKAPEITDPNVWVIKDFKDASKGMPLPPLPSFPQIAVKPGTVRGMVKDAGGKPIAGAHFVVQASAAGGFRTSVEGRTNAQGMYEIPLPIGICQVVNADCHVTYNGQEMNLPLHPADGVRDEFNAKEGHVENFVLRTSGSSGESGGNYGGAIRINTHDAPLGSIIEVTLKPTGALLDGSKGRTLVFRYTVKTALPETIVNGIPVGSYTLTAKLYDGDDALPMQARKTFTDEPGEELPLMTALPIVFRQASGGDKNANLGQSGVQRFEVVLQP